MTPRQANATIKQIERRFGPIVQPSSAYVVDVPIGARNGSKRIASRFYIPTEPELWELSSEPHPVPSSWFHEYVRLDSGIAVHRGLAEEAGVEHAPFHPEDARLVIATPDERKRFIEARWCVGTGSYTGPVAHAYRRTG